MKPGDIIRMELKPGSRQSHAAQIHVSSTKVASSSTVSEELAVGRPLSPAPKPQSRTGGSCEGYKPSDLIQRSQLVVLKSWSIKSCWINQLEARTLLPGFAGVCPIMLVGSGRGMALRSNIKISQKRPYVGLVSHHSKKRY